MMALADERKLCREPGRGRTRPRNVGGEIMPIHPGDGPSQPRDYPLYLSGPAGFRWRLNDCGVTLAADRLAWAYDGARYEETFSDIAAIRLQMTSAGQTPVGMCKIRFRDGAELTVHGGNSSNSYDAGQAEIYEAFVRDLHAPLARGRFDRIDFEAGMTQARYTGFTIVMAIAIAMFVVLPVVLFLIVRTVEVLFLMVGSIALIWPFYRLWKNNRPRAYSPDDLPNDLLRSSGSGLAALFAND
jgi:hypothetical protein